MTPFTRTDKVMIGMFISITALAVVAVVKELLDKINDKGRGK